MKSLLSCLLLVLLSVSTVYAQALDNPPKYEFRGAWISTVMRLDWPKSSDPAVQRQELVWMLDDLKATGINAVFFQVRSEADAMYPSEIEPWSHWLTGTQGQAPEPFYDPLLFAIEEAHKRGIELHAWFNPFRVQRNAGGYTLDPSHVAVEHPEWTLTIGNIQFLNPGLPDVRDYVTSVIMDVVRRYDIDGVHFDDYFYPYPPDQITNQDDPTFTEHSRGIADIADWRRDNINRFVAQVSDSIVAVKPEVKFGISPFGIWKNGVPPGIVGLDAYDVLYADATAWLESGDVDYLSPQLYWPFGGGQDYGKLAPWWASVTNGRHLYPGLALYKPYEPDEIPRQIRLNREHTGIQGQVMFRTQNLLTNALNVRDSLQTNLYAYPAITPPMAWRNQTPPGIPQNLSYEWTGAFEVTLSWAPPDGETEAQRYAIYRIRSAEAPDVEAVLSDARNLLAITGDTTFTDVPDDAADPYYYFVTALSANSIESEPTDVLEVEACTVYTEGCTVGVEPEQPTSFQLEQNYPNPFNPSTTIAFTLERPGAVTLRVYDLLGRRIATLIDGRTYVRGTHTIEWSGLDAAGHAVASGTYVYALEANGHKQSRIMTLLK